MTQARKLTMQERLAAMHERMARKRAQILARFEALKGKLSTDEGEDDE